MCRCLQTVAMIVFLPNQGGFTRKMTPASHIEALNREQRPNGAGVNSVDTDEYISFFNQLFRDGMMVEGEMDGKGMPTFDYNEDKWKILYRVLGPLYFPDDPEWVPEVHPRYSQYLWQQTADDDYEDVHDKMEASEVSKPEARHPLTGKLLTISAESDTEQSDQHDEFEPSNGKYGTLKEPHGTKTSTTSRNSSTARGNYRNAKLR